MLTCFFVAVLALSPTAPCAAQSQLEEFAALTWEIEARRMLGEYISGKNYSYDSDAHPSLNSSAEAYSGFIVNFYYFDDWLRDHYSIDRIPTILALAKNPVYLLHQDHEV